MTGEREESFEGWTNFRTRNPRVWALVGVPVLDCYGDVGRSESQRLIVNWVTQIAHDVIYKGFKQKKNVR